MGLDKKISSERIYMEHTMGKEKKQKGKSDGRYNNGYKRD